MKIGAPRLIADLVAGALPHLSSQWQERLLEQDIKRIWRELVGPDVARRAQPQKLVQGCLRIYVDNSPWLQELTLRAEELTARLQRVAPGVTSVRFILGAVPPEPTRERSGRPAPPPPLAPAETQEIHQAVSVIGDPALARTARRVLTKAWQAQRSRGVSR